MNNLFCSIIQQPICELIEVNEAQGGIALVHCIEGKSRSASLCVAYLLWKNGCKNVNHHMLFEILEYVKHRRPIVEPNPTFMKNLMAWAKFLEEKETISEGPMVLIQVEDREKLQAINDINHLTMQIKSQLNT